MIFVKELGVLATAENDVAIETSKVLDKIVAAAAIAVPDVVEVMDEKDSCKSYRLMLMKAYVAGCGLSGFT